MTVSKRLLETIKDGLLDRDTLIMACLRYMSEDDVADMVQANELDWVMEYEGESFEEFEQRLRDMGFEVNKTLQEKGDA